jgi:LacI family transcriptional regulator
MNKTGFPSNASAHPTIRDVAKKAGVSPAMVSRVMTGNGYVALSKKERIQRTVDELGYVQPGRSGAWKQKSMPTLGLLVSWGSPPDVRDQFFSDTLSSILEVCSQRGYQLVIRNFVGLFSQSSDSQFRDFVDKNTLQGVFLLAPRSNAATIKRLARETKAGMILLSHSNNAVSYVDADQESAMEQAVQYLAAKGHQRICLVAGETRLNSNAASRHNAFMRAMRLNNLEVAPEQVFSGLFDSRTGRRAARKFMAMPSPPTAIVTSSDQQAVGVAAVLKKTGVPRGMELVTYGDRPQNSGSLPVTHIHLPFAEIGRIAAGQMIENLADGTHKKIQITLPTKISFAEGRP